MINLSYVYFDVPTFWAMDILSFRVHRIHSLVHKWVRIPLENAFFYSFPGFWEDCEPRRLLSVHRVLICLAQWDLGSFSKWRCHLNHFLFTSHCFPTINFLGPLSPGHRKHWASIDRCADYNAGGLLPRGILWEWEKPIVNIPRGARAVGPVAPTILFVFVSENS